jgi:hypothetical protein
VTIASSTRNIYIVEDRSCWIRTPENFDLEQDLVLTFDFSLWHLSRSMGGRAEFLDSLSTQAENQSNNFVIQDYLRHWYQDGNGEDIFRYQSINFGPSLLLEIWNGVVDEVRLALCLSVVSNTVFEKLFLISPSERLQDFVSYMGLSAEVHNVARDLSSTVYYFPIQQWLDSKFAHSSLRLRISEYVLNKRAQGMFVLLRSRILNTKKKNIFIHEYHPTMDLLTHFQKKSDCRVFQGDISRARGFRGLLLKDLPIPLYGRSNDFIKKSEELADDFMSQSGARIITTTGQDLTVRIKSLIHKRLIDTLPRYLQSLSSIKRNFNAMNLDLIVLISNLGRIPSLLHCIAQYSGTPSFLIINGMLLSDFMDEAKRSDFINSYSTSIRDNYFSQQDNVFALGDPRMDKYIDSRRNATVTNRPVVTIGTSGFNPVDINSNLAVEFQFLSEVLTAIKLETKSDFLPRVILKIRANNYKHQYQSFVDEYFSMMAVEIAKENSIEEVLSKSDLYISIYSQTLFQAAALGVPTIYHKSDRELMHTPFDGESELVTTSDISSLCNAIRDFSRDSSRFDLFMERKVLEKYIGPLDGHNLQRNSNFIEKLLTQNG